MRDWLATGEVNTYADLVCSACYNVIATVSLGPADGSEPQVLPPVLPPRAEAEDAPTEPEDNALRRVQTINLRRKDETVTATVRGLRGTGENLAAALRDLAHVLERSRASRSRRARRRWPDMGGRAPRRSAAQARWRFRTRT